MVLDKIPQKQPGSILGKISIYAGLLNILLLVAGTSLSKYAGQAVSTFIFLALMISFSIGITTGIAALVARKAWLGLLINALMIVFFAIAFFVYFSFCCKPPPQL